MRALPNVDSHIMCAILTWHVCEKTLQTTKTLYTPVNSSKNDSVHIEDIDETEMAHKDNNVH